MSNSRKSYNKWSSPAIPYISHSTKPSNFKQVDSKERIYTCLCYVYCTGCIDKIDIQYKIIDRTKIDNEWTRNYIKNNICPKFKMTERTFKRDGSGFIFIHSISVESKEEYFNMKKINQRKNKLDSL